MGFVRLAARPSVAVQPSLFFTRFRKSVSAQVRPIGGWKRLSGSSYDALGDAR